MSLLFSRSRTLINALPSSSLSLRNASTLGGSRSSTASFNSKSSVPSRHFVPLSIVSASPLKPQYVRVAARFVATSVSNKPASQTFSQTALNVKEETSNFAADAAKMISGDRMNDAGASFVKQTKAMAGQVPGPIMTMGLLGTVPYVGAGVTTVWCAQQAGLAAQGVSVGIDPGVALTVLDQALNVQVTYGAVILSFLGALHWGMEFAGVGGHKGYSRLLLGAAPVVFAWPTLALQPMTALLWQWIGFTALWGADSKVTAMGWTPKWYSQYRFYLSILVGTCIIGSLAGCSYWGPVAGHGFISHDLALIREQRADLEKKREGHVATGKGELEAVPSKMEESGWVTIKDKEGKNVLKDN